MPSQLLTEDSKNVRHNVGLIMCSIRLICILANNQTVRKDFIAAELQFEIEN